MRTEGALHDDARERKAPPELGEDAQPKHKKACQQQQWLAEEQRSNKEPACEGTPRPSLRVTLVWYELTIWIPQHDLLLARLDPLGDLLLAARDTVSHHSVVDCHPTKAPLCHGS
jgi:hypothetical protein